MYNHFQLQSYDWQIQYTYHIIGITVTVSITVRFIIIVTATLIYITFINLGWNVAYISLKIIPFIQVLQKTNGNRATGIFNIHHLDVNTDERMTHELQLKVIQ